MSKKLQGNGIWEASRMMLPQHKESINRYRLELEKRTKPILHEDEWEIIFQNINLSLLQQERVIVTIFGECINLEIEGVVTNVSQHLKKFKIENEEGYDWIDFNEIVSIKIK
ncbi:YolD-like family protein [Paenibacillus odorifer]|uniref:YolD-like family protein n=1 Tax=Paenibacillus odorifer TaxID=189426 RepID=UPI00096D77A2|nr:YolD-like family protein [Paenibacillus odorifer]OMD76834.1 hypothetical protein BSK50_13865 [Paenibacillus odorifer]